MAPVPKYIRDADINKVYVKELKRRIIKESEHFMKDTYMSMTFSRDEAMLARQAFTKGVEFALKRLSDVNIFLADMRRQKYEETTLGKGLHRDEKPYSRK